MVCNSGGRNGDMPVVHKAMEEKVYELK